MFSRFSRFIPQTIAYASRKTFATVSKLTLTNVSKSIANKPKLFLGSVIVASSIPVIHCADKLPIYGIAGTKNERTFIAVKPDGVQKALVGEIIKRFEAKGYKLVAIKMVTPTKSHAEAHYADLSSKPFFGDLVKYFSSGAVVAMVFEGKNVIKAGRQLVGATDPQQALPGSIRGDFAIDISANLIHGSDAPDSAKSEISLWFNEKEINEWNRS